MKHQNAGRMPGVLMMGLCSEPWRCKLYCARNEIPRIPGWFKKTPVNYRGFSEQMTGIEPASPAWEAGVLPMNYICARAGNGTRTRDLRITNASLYRLSYSGTLPVLFGNSVIINAGKGFGKHFFESQQIRLFPIDILHLKSQPETGVFFQRVP